MRQGRCPAQMCIFKSHQIHNHPQQKLQTSAAALTCRRAAVDLQIQQQKAQRDQLEAFKQQELQEERQELQQWQQKLKDQGDESDYEEEPADAAAQVISHGDQQACAQGSTAAPGHHSSSTGTSTEEAYHGRGWWPSKAADTSSPSECAVTGSGSNDDSSSNSSPSSGALQHLTASPAYKAADACQAVTTLHDSAATGRSTAYEPFITTSSTRRLSANPSPHTENSQTSTAAGPGTTSSTDSTSSKPSRPVAPVRSRVAPVPVTFTQLETPHLPARKQREVEIKQIKKAAGKVCGYCHRTWCSCLPRLVRAGACMRVCTHAYLMQASDQTFRVLLPYVGNLRCILLSRHRSTPCRPTAWMWPTGSPPS